MPFYEIISLFTFSLRILFPGSAPFTDAYSMKPPCLNIELIPHGLKHKQTDGQMDGGFLPIIKPAVS